jgi:Protein of unknown function (DUF935)
MVIEWNFGNGVEPLARVELIVPVQEDATKVVTAATLLADRGAQISSGSLMDRLNLPKATDSADALRAASASPAPALPPADRAALANSAPAVPDADLQSFRKALAADMQPLGDALLAAYQSGDFAAMTGALKKISSQAPDYAGDARELSMTLAVAMADAWVGEGRAEIENAGNSDGATKGWETRRANGWVPAPRLITPAEADAELDRGFFVANQAGESIRFGAELRKKLDEKVLNDADRNARKQRLRWAKLAVSDGAYEATKQHGNTRTIYAKTFRKGPKHQDVEVIVDTINGYAWNIMVKGGSAHVIR